MKRISFILFLCVIVSVASAQKITHTFQDIPLSDALKYIQEKNEDYNITFIYDELEDFRVTTHIQDKSIPDAVVQIVGFYPVRVVKSGKHEIYVECTHKTDCHLRGTIIDEQGLPVAYANVAVLNPADSTLLCGGVSNESGFFIIPIDQANILARISYVGYKTIFMQCNNTELGTIRIMPETMTLKGVVVKGEIPQYKMTSGGMTVDIQNSLLKDVGTADDVLSMLPQVQGSDGNFTVFAKGTPEIYINNKKVRNAKELKQLKSDNIKSVDVISSPGAKYDAEVNAVIRIKTIHPQGEGFSVEAFGQVANNTKWTTYDDLSMKYRQDGLELFSTVTFYNDHHSEDNRVGFESNLNGDHITLDQTCPNKFWYSDISGEVGISYDFNDNNSLGFKYSLEGSIYMKGDAKCVQTINRNGSLEGIVDQWMETRESDGPIHETNIYYVGKAGKLGIDFNGSWLWNKRVRNDIETERSEQLEDRDIHIHNVDHRNMLAGKLVLSYPVWKGNLSIGSEVTHTHSNGTNENEEHYVKSSDDDIKESNLAGFAEYELQLGKWSINGGVRYEYVSTDYHSFGQYQEEPSRKYNELFPNLSVNWQKGKWGAEISYNKRIKRPSYYMLSSYIQYDNRYEVEGGNPLLRPTIRQDIDLRLNYSWLSLSAGYTQNKDMFFSFGSLYEQGSDVVIWTRRNFEHHEALHASIVVSPKFGFYQPTLTLSYWQQHFPTKYSGVGLALDKPDWNISLRNWFVIDESAKAMLYIRYVSSYDYGFTRNSHKFNVDLRLQKSFLGDKLTAIVFAYDIFKTLREKWQAVYPVAAMTKDAYVYTQKFGVSLTYKFNSTRSKYKGTGAGNEEKNRL